MTFVRLLAWPCAVICMGCAHTAADWELDVAPPGPPPAAVPDAPAPLTERAAPIATPDIVEPASPLPVTRDGALLTGLLGNQFIEVSRLDPEISATFVDEERAIFDPRILARVSMGHEETRSADDNSLTVDSSVGGEQITSVQALLRQVQRLNRNLDALRQNNDSGTDTVGGALALEQYLPTGTLLFLSGAGENADNDGDGLRDSWSVGVSQPLLRGGSVRANLAGLKQARIAVEESEHEFYLRVMDTMREIEMAYWELVLARDVVRIREFAVALAEEQVRREEGLFGVGKALRGDVITAGAERSAREADLAQATAALESQTIELIRLMHPSDTPPWGLQLDPQDEPQVVEITPQPEESEALALSYRPELAQARLGLERLELDVLRARNERLPRLDLVGTYGDGANSISTSVGVNSRNFETGENYNIGLEFETGIPNRAERARYRRAQLESRRGEGIISQLEENIAAEVRRAIAQVNGQWKRLVATAEAVLSREESVRVVEGRRNVGMATNLDVLQTQRDFIESQVEDVTARVRYVQALTELYMAEGTLLERRGITVDAAAEEEPDTMQRPAYATE